MIKIELDDGEINALMQLFDRALRHSGMEAQDAVTHFRKKINEARGGNGAWPGESSGIGAGGDPGPAS